MTATNINGVHHTDLGIMAAVPLLKLDGVSKTFPGHGQRSQVSAVDNVNFTVMPGETLGIVGASGAGKSTVARIIASLESADTGTIRFDGHDTATMGRAARKQLRRDVHLVFQDPYASLCPTMRVGDIVAEPLAIHRHTGMNRSEAATQSLRRAHLDPDTFRHRRPHELSGGERQRVALARAIIARPKLIIADEPTAMLDASLRSGILDLLRDLRTSDGIAFLYITHDLAVAQAFCHRIAVMDHGQIVEHGPTKRVLDTPQHPATVRLVAAARQLTIETIR